MSRSLPRKAWSVEQSATVKVRQTYLDLAQMQHSRRHFHIFSLMCRIKRLKHKPWAHRTGQHSRSSSPRMKLQINAIRTNEVR
jgi:hypothetical protein